MARALVRAAPRGVVVTAADFSLPMLRFASRKASAPPYRRVCAALPRLAFADATFDQVTLAFATRNINLDRSALRSAFREILRVLKPGGRFLNLETSQPPNRFVRGLFHLYVRTAVRPLGEAISGSRSGYVYLSSTIRRFHDASALTAVLTEAGFEKVSHTRLFFGVAAVHSAWKTQDRPPPF